MSLHYYLALPGAGTLNICVSGIPEHSQHGGIPGCGQTAELVILAQLGKHGRDGRAVLVLGDNTARLSACGNVGARSETASPRQPALSRAGCESLSR